MGEGQEFKTRSAAEHRVEVQERGEIFFFYRPKVERQEAHSQDDVQRLYIILRPESGENTVQQKQDSDSGKEGALKNISGQSSSSTEGGHGTQAVNVEEQSLLRFIIMGRKSLPHPSKKGRPYWGFVDMVTTNIQDVKTALQGEEYDTSTRGHRHVSAARALGEGIYRILRHYPENRSNYHTHLIYKLEFPSQDEDNQPQKSFNIEREGSYLIQIKNPDQHGADSQYRAGLQNKRRAKFPAHLQGQFGNKRYHSAEPAEYLNFEGCEFLLISASDDIEEELGVELKCETEGTEDASSSDLLKTFGDTVSTEPLLKGTWV